MLRSIAPSIAVLTLLAGCAAGGKTEPVADTAPTSTKDAVVGQGVRFAPPSGWIKERPSSGMRIAQYQLPGAAGTGPASLVVYYFGAGAGSVESNIDRWCGQFEQPDGRNSRETAMIQRDQGTMGMTTVDVGGTYVAETSPGSGERVHEADWRMLAAIAPTEGGPYYVKLVGPDRTVQHWRSSYREFLAGMRPAAVDAPPAESMHP